MRIFPGKGEKIKVINDNQSIDGKTGTLSYKKIWGSEEVYAARGDDTKPAKERTKSLREKKTS